VWVFVEENNKFTLYSQSRKRNRATAPPVLEIYPGLMRQRKYQGEKQNKNK